MHNTHLTLDMTADMASQGWHFVGGGGESVRRFCVMGERSSGTNHVQWAMDQGTCLKDVNRNRWRGNAVATRLSKLPGVTLKEPSVGPYGWKHGIPSFPAVGRRDLIIVAFPNLFDWLVSMYAKPWHINDSMLSLSFSEFIRAPWDARVDRPTRYFDLPNKADFDGLPLRLDRHPVTGEMYDDILHMRTVKINGFLGLMHLGGNVAFLRHDKFTVDAATCLTQMSQHYRFRLSGRDTRTDLRMGSEWKFDVQSRYEEAKAAITRETEYILSSVDLGTEKRVGFDYVS